VHPFEAQMPKTLIASGMIIKGHFTLKVMISYDNKNFFVASVSIAVTSNKETKVVVVIVSEIKKNHKIKL